MKLHHLFSILFIFLFSLNANALVMDVIIEGSDSIWLSGRTDLTIPPASDPWPGGLIRHSTPTPEEIQETMPPGFSVMEGDIIRLLDPADGAISFFNGFGGISYGPEGNGPTGSSVLSSFGGISGYIGTQGALAGVFLDDAIPNGIAPSTLDFSLSGLGIDFSSLTPDIGQVFFIGDGVNASSEFQEFIAPMGATRMYLGVTDGFGFMGAPGAYDDNDGSYRVRVGINDDPTRVPEPLSVALLGFGLLLVRWLRIK